MNTKQCTKCKELKPVTEFGPHPGGRDGLRSDCKTCNAAKSRAYRAAHLKESQERSRRHHASNPEETRKYMRAYYAAHREKAKEQSRVYRLAHAEKLREQYRAYHAAHREEKRAERAAHPEKIRERMLKSNYGLSLDDYDAMVVAQEGKCAICGADGGKGLFVDHDHVSGKPRALLCSKCNSAIGFLNDDAQLVMKAFQYLSKWNTRAGGAGSQD